MMLQRLAAHHVTTHIPPTTTPLRRNEQHHFLVARKYFRSYAAQPALADVPHKQTDHLSVCRQISGRPPNGSHVHRQDVSPVSPPLRSQRLIARARRLCHNICTCLPLRLASGTPQHLPDTNTWAHYHGAAQHTECPDAASAYRRISLPQDLWLSKSPTAFIHEIHSKATHPRPRPVPTPPVRAQSLGTPVVLRSPNHVSPTIMHPSISEDPDSWLQNDGELIWQFCFWSS